MNPNDRRYLGEIAQLVRTIAQQMTYPHHNAAIDTMHNLAGAIDEWATSDVIRVAALRTSTPPARTMPGMTRCPHTHPDGGWRCYLSTGHADPDHAATGPDGALYSWPVFEDQDHNVKNAPDEFEYTGPTEHRFELPPKPVTERRVRDKWGHVWEVVPAGVTRNGRPVIAWAAFLSAYGPAELVPLTDDELRDAELYGPPGQRWGNIGEPCPYQGPSGLDTVDGYSIPLPCALWRNHAGPHKDHVGAELGTTQLDDTLPAITAGISPQEAAQSPCTCGVPAAHLFDCPRYPRTTGGHTVIDAGDDDGPIGVDPWLWDGSEYRGEPSF